MKDSKIFKDAFILFAITLIAGLGLGFAYNLTREPIETNRNAQILKANQAIFPAAASFDADDKLAAKVADYADVLKTSSSDFGKVSINEVLEAKAADGQLLGYIISSTSGEGYGGNITISLGVDLSGKVTGLEFTEIDETVGFGAGAVEPAFKGQFVDKTVDAFAWTKGDATADNEIKAISGATKTTKAVTNAVNAALYFAAQGLLK